MATLPMAKCLTLYWHVGGLRGRAGRCAMILSQVVPKILRREKLSRGPTRIPRSTREDSFYENHR